MKYAFIQAHRTEFRLTSMCRVLKVHRSGFYAWLHEPLSPRAKANEALTAKIKEFHDQSMGIYGSPRIYCDLREVGVACGEDRVVRLMRAALLRVERVGERMCKRRVRCRLLAEMAISAVRRNPRKHAVVGKKKPTG